MVSAVGAVALRPLSVLFTDVSMGEVGVVRLKRPNVHVIHLGGNAGLVRRSRGWRTRSLVGGVMVGGAG